MADYVSGIFVEADYVSADYVGTDADLYVETGYVSGAVDGGTVSINASATTTADSRIAVFADASISSQTTLSATPTGARSTSKIARTTSFRGAPFIPGLPATVSNYGTSPRRAKTTRSWT